ncbi:MAG TPA: hypothetical protein ENK90_01925, partial [Epsilonproteobacteria bacterium]|nr:hypothetical protein [Campylobacterota bacterium]
MVSTPLTVEQIMEQFSQQTFQRGYSYYVNGFVNLCTIVNVPTQKGTIKIFSQVEGSYNYEQSITISSGIVEGECSCPVGHNCKHVVAALFYAIHEKELNSNINTVDPIDAWINEFETLQTQESKNLIAQDDYFLIYRLFMEDYGDNQLNFYRAKILKNGKLSKGSKISNDTYLRSYEYYYDYTNERDKELGDALNGIAYGYSSSIKFTGEYGTILLKQLIQTDRCFFKDSSTPLRMSPHKKLLTFEWREEDGLSWMHPNLSEEEQLLHLVTPPLCVNTKTNEVQVVETPYNSETIAFLFASPKFPSEKVDNMVHNILERLPEVEFPLPPKFEIIELDITPTNHLHLFGKQREDQTTMHIMQLSFDYEGHQFPSNSYTTSSIVTKNNQTIKLKRH